MSTNLDGIRTRARKSRQEKFTSLYHHIYDEDNLRDCYKRMDGKKAKGIDGVSKIDYGKDLESNLGKLSKRLKQMSYRPQVKRRVYIQKAGSEKGRPLGISCFEDKIVEKAVKQVLEGIYEEMFEENSYGYRPGRSQHDCLRELGRIIKQERVGYVVEADIRGFFDQVNHDWMMKFLEHRIRDKRVLRLIHRMLKGGMLEDGLVKTSESGTPQGSILSPLLSNIYLHYALDAWFNRKMKPQFRGESYLLRFADDHLVCFQYKDDALKYLELLRERMGKFHLQLAEEKTQCIAFGRFAREDAYKQGAKPKEFTFLGFTHYCGRNRNGKFAVKRRTSKKKLQQSLTKFKLWAKMTRHKLTKGEMIRKAIIRLKGYLNYYAVTDNYEMCQLYNYKLKHILLKWLNRKSQRHAYTWPRYLEALKTCGWPKVEILINMYPS